MIKTFSAVCFDLGDTLIYPQGVPLSWATLYSPALKEVGEKCGLTPSLLDISSAEQILRKYNTRIIPRTREVCSDLIMKEILDAWRLDTSYLQTAISAFFSFFQRKQQMYDDTVPVLQFLKQEGLKVGILTDVPYGMPRVFVERDVAPFESFIDVLVTSTDVGFRKPEGHGYLRMCEELKVKPCAAIYVGNEQKDIEGANQAGLYSVLLDRENDLPLGWGERLRIASLEELRCLQ